MTDPVAETAAWVLDHRNARRLGRVRVSAEFLDDNPDHAKQLGEVVKVEHSWAYGYSNAEFTFRGPAFDVVPEGGEVPLYEVITHMLEGKLDRMEIRKCQT